MSLCHLTVFTIKTDSSLTLNQTVDLMLANMTTYQQYVRKLIYLDCVIQPDIVYIIRQLSCHNLDARANHLCIDK